MGGDSHELVEPNGSQVRFNDLVERLDSVDELKGDEDLDKLITALKLRIDQRGYCSGKILEELSQAIILKIAPVVDVLENAFPSYDSLTKQTRMELEIARNKAHKIPIRASFFLHAYRRLKKAFD